MDMIEQYHSWKKEVTHVEYLMNELESINGNHKEISDRFWRDLEFGTGGLRGLMGAGSNRINLFTVGKATQGLSNYLKQENENPSVIIAYDTRNFSLEFARHAAGIFCANGINTSLFEDVRPTPMLSYAVRHLGADAGIVITASHNPKEYNGYKVYGSDGGQITDEMAAAVLDAIDACHTFQDVSALDWANTQASHLFHSIGEAVDMTYYEKVKQLTMRNDLIQSEARNLNILYSPLHGSGNIPVRRVLQELGFSNVQVVPEQEKADGNFPTVPYPNPEEPAVYQLAIEQAKQSNPDLIFATDPDCDRIGVLVKDDGGAFSVLTGNQIGVLLSDYIINSRKMQGTMPPNPAIIKTIVTSDMGKVICEKNNVFMPETLTGFKYIGEQVSQWQEDRTHSFLFGFEESYGYLAGNFVRDKDAVIAAVLISEMALYYKSQNLSLFQAMEQLYQTYGYYQEKLISVTMPGQEGQAKIKTILENLRKEYNTVFAAKELAFVEDYAIRQRHTLSNDSKEMLYLPSSNVLKFIFSDGSWIVFRPSGTEPKIKVYLSAVGADMQSAQLRLDGLISLSNEILS